MKNVLQKAAKAAKKEKQQAPWPCSHMATVQLHKDRSCCCVFVSFDWSANPRIVRQTCLNCKQPFTEIVQTDRL
jgi:hypothetical protein